MSRDVDTEMTATFIFLEKHELGNEYLLGFRLTNEFAVGDSLNDISMKFRAKTIVGEDVIASKAVPNQEKALQIGGEGLKNLSKRFERRWLNLSHWSNDYAQKRITKFTKTSLCFMELIITGKQVFIPKPDKLQRRLFTRPT